MRVVVNLFLWFLDFHYSSDFHFHHILSAFICGNVLFFLYLVKWYPYHDCERVIKNDIKCNKTSINIGVYNDTTADIAPCYLHLPQTLFVA